MSRLVYEQITVQLYLTWNANRLLDSNRNK